jgi:hypothetical protein
MNSKSAVTAIVGRMKKRASSETLNINDAAKEIAQALRIETEPATMTLYGLCATGRVRSLDDQGQVIDEDECTIGEFGNKPKHVIASDVRSFLTDWSPDPLPSKREAVIRAMIIAEGLNPPRNIEWKPFCDRVRDECNGWLPKGRPAWGFGDRHIRRIVRDLRSK